MLNVNVDSRTSNMTFKHVIVGCTILTYHKDVVPTPHNTVYSNYVCMVQTVYYIHKLTLHDPLYKVPVL